MWDFLFIFFLESGNSNFNIDGIDGLCSDVTDDSYKTLLILPKNINLRHYSTYDSSIEHQ